MSLIYYFALIAIAQFCFAVFAILKKTDKVTDLSYGLTFVAIALHAFLAGPSSTSKIVVLALISIWGVRLSGYLFMRIMKKGRDKRFDEIRERPLRFAGFWILQTVSIFVILIPSILFMDKAPQAVTTLFWFGAFLSFVGIVIETVADAQKSSFKLNPENRNRWIDTGLWKHSRHPNYLGEIMVWTGLFISVTPYLNGLEFLSIISPIYITVLILFVSGIPPLKRRYEEKYGNLKEYQEYKERTGLILPRLQSAG